MIEDQFFLTQTLSIGLKSWELTCDRVQPTHFGQMIEYRLK